ncbi:MAG: AI-2E family transporter [Balneolaceae bacterium]|nr:MAG: AI-2E family transporter [Balneolaceae bacterium]
MMDIDQKWYVKYTYILAALILTVYAMIMAKTILLPLLFALFFSILLSPFCGWLERYKVPRILSSLAAILVGLMFLIGIGFFFYNQMAAFVRDADMFVERLEELIESLDVFLTTWFAFEGEINLDRIVSEIIDLIRENTATLTRRITGAASTITAVLLVPIYMYLILLFRDLIKTFILKAFGKGISSNEEKVKSIIIKVKTLVQRYIAGLLMVIAILAVLNSIMLIIIGVDHAIFFGVFAAMLNVIPFVGPIMGSILPILYSLITMDSLIYPVIILLGFYIIQLFESNLFTPTIVGSQVSMNALATLLLIFIGAQIWGLAGMILFIPIGAILKVICDEVESLNHFGYLLGRETGDKSEERSALAKKVRQLRTKAVKMRKKKKDNSN